MSLAGAQQSAANTMNDIKNSQTVQNVANGPVADKARTEAAATQKEFGNLAASRQTPHTQTATGQDLTHYHSFFYNLLSWENPRATGISYATIILSILAIRYVPVAKYALKALYIILGITAAAEIAGKTILGQGVASKMRPRKYYTVPQETLESIIVDAVELANFFVIEFQRIVFAENVYATVAAFVSSFITYWLIKIMPTWGLILFFTTVIYFAPLAYITNKDLIDEHLGNAQKIVSDQADQVRTIAAQHTGKAWEATQSSLKEYSAKASGAIGQTKQAAVDKGYISEQTAEKVTPSQPIAEHVTPSQPIAEQVTPSQPIAEKVTPEPEVNGDDFPPAPNEDPAVPEVVDPTSDVKPEPIAA